jgi:hypothetical protein
LDKLKKRCWSPLQEKILEDLFEREALIHMDDDHVYSTNNGRDIFTSMTTAIGGKFDDTAGLYERNRLFGNDFDMLLEGLAQGKSFKDLKGSVKALDMALAAQAYGQLQNYVYAMMQEGAVLVPQLKVFDPESKIAGTLDLLMIKPDGSMTVIDLKVSKHSILEDKYALATNKTREGSRLKNLALSTKTKHGIQVCGYQRLLEVTGYYPEQTMTYHFKVDVKGENKDQEVTHFYSQGATHHLQSEYKSYVDRIIPTKPAPDKIKVLLREMGWLTEDVDLEAEHDEALRKSEVLELTLKQMRAGIEDFREKVRRRIDRMEMIKTSVSFNSPANKMMYKLNQLVMIMGKNLTSGQTQLAYGAFLRYAIDELKDLSDYMSEPNNRSKEGFIEKVLEASRYLETYRGMVNSTQWPQVTIATTEHGAKQDTGNPRKLCAGRNDGKHQQKRDFKAGVDSNDQTIC